MLEHLVCLNGVWNSLCPSRARPSVACLGTHNAFSFYVTVIHTGVPLSSGNNMQLSSPESVQFFWVTLCFLSFLFVIYSLGRELNWLLGERSFCLCDYWTNLLRVNWRNQLRKPLKQYFSAVVGMRVLWVSLNIADPRTSCRHWGHCTASAALSRLWETLCEDVIVLFFCPTFR